MRARLAQAERRLRITSVGWLVAAVVVAVLWIGAQQAQSQSATISTHRLAVVDQGGKERIVLSFDTNGHPAIWLRDDAGHDRMFIGFGTSGRPLIGLSDDAGHLRLSLGFSLDRNTPQLVLLDENGKQRAYLGFSGAGQTTPELDLADERGTDRIYLGWSTTEKPAIILDDESGKTLWSAP